MKFLEVRSTYLDDNEQGAFNDVNVVQLEVPSAVNYVHIVLRPCADLDGLHHREHPVYHVDPLNLGKLPPDSAYRVQY